MTKHSCRPTYRADNVKRKGRTARHVPWLVEHFWRLQRNSPRTLTTCVPLCVCTNRSNWRTAPIRPEPPGERTSEVVRHERFAKDGRASILRVLSSRGSVRPSSTTCVWRMLWPLLVYSLRLLWIGRLSMLENAEGVLSVCNRNRFFIYLDGSAVICCLILVGLHETYEHG